MYLPDSNVLVTRLLSPEGVGEVVDFVPGKDLSRGKRLTASCTPCVGPCASGSNAAGPQE
jgi:hypothetical protein